MRIWFLNQFYPPDRAPTGVMLEAVVGQLAKDGHACVVWCSGGSYGTETNGVIPSNEPQKRSNADAPQVIRLGNLGAGKSFFAKLSGWLGFYLILTLRLLLARDRPEVIVAMTTPPFLSVLARIAAWRHGARHAHWMMDLYPDALAAHGMMSASSFPYHMLERLAQFGFNGNRAAAVVTLGPCMAERIQPHVDRPVSWVPLWATAEPCQNPANVTAAARQLRLERGWAEDEVVILYSGNLGRGHVVLPALQAALELGRAGKRLRWVFCAHGARLAEVETFAQTHPEACIEFLKPVPTSQLDAHLASADVHLASLEKTWSGCMVPSKIQGSFAAGRAVLFIGPQTSSPARWICEAAAGWTCEASDAARQIVDWLSAVDLKSQSARRGDAARAFSALHFSRDTNARAVADQFLESHEET